MEGKKKKYTSTVSSRAEQIKRLVESRERGDVKFRFIGNSSQFGKSRSLPWEGLVADDWRALIVPRLISLAICEEERAMESNVLFFFGNVRFLDDRDEAGHRLHRVLDACPRMNSKGERWNV